MDRLTIINDALRNTGNNTVNFEYDGSTEWENADPAYRRAISFLIASHPWNFANTSAPLAGLLPSSPHLVLDKAYQLPNDCMLVEAAWLNGHPLGEYEIMDQKLCCRYDSGVTVKYVRAPEPGQWPPLFVELATMQVEAYLLRGLNEDTDNARKRDADVRNLLDEVRSAQDRQEPPRALFRSRTAHRRRGRGSRTIWAP
ncbi:hypothetical protein [Bosea sp. BK604]|uniref:hypothetical protein n=1 Tax=Bosea sp. BK604 TaxID=2512180 RepID=UPI0010E997D4|nr:hypothetical protein [Bosea sp. BK604]TCR64694.1 hypothetical protein EV560_106160 [Bosea sp. BK604]